jgi:O-antigen/teichoic acid export membrane protein
MACLPISAILFSLQARVYKKGHESGLVGTLGALRRPVVISWAYCLVVAIGLYVGAPAVPWLLGNSYQSSTQVLQWLALLPFLLVVNGAGSEALSGADAQRRLSLLHALTAGMSLLLNVMLVPSYGWQGAVMAAYGSQAFLAASLLLTIAWLQRAGRKASR